MYYIKWLRIISSYLIKPCQPVLEVGREKTEHCCLLLRSESLLFLGITFWKIVLDLVE